MQKDSMKRSRISIMAKLIVTVKPLLHVMIIAVVLGILGFLCAIGIPTGAAVAVAGALGASEIPFKTVAICIICFGILRGIFRYGEQACNHYIAFKILALIRNKVFTSLRRLAPAKLEGKKKGELIAVITSDVELLEVFYAHTVSPVLIAIGVSLIITGYLWTITPVLALLAAVAYICVGCIIPIIISSKGQNTGFRYRNDFAGLNAVLYDSLRGIDEILQFRCADRQYKKIRKQEESLGQNGSVLRRLEGIQRGITDCTILIFSLASLVLSACLYKNGLLTFDDVIVSTVLLMSSFGPVVALSNLSNNLNQTLASGERVLDILEEEPVVIDIDGENATDFGPVEIKDVTFAYETDAILKNVTLEIKEKSVLGILGKSGSGKSTLLKLLMRFWNVDSGAIEINNRALDKINTEDLRNMQSYVTQETWLFKDTIKNNISVAKPDATYEEIAESCRKAGIHDFIESLPDGYETQIAELGDSLSGGERQRIGVARAFLHNSPMVLLDEPTSNLDALNESHLLNSIEELSKEKTVVLVSHRPSTMGVATEILKMNEKRSS